MSFPVLKKDVQDFIRAHAMDDVRKLLLKSKTILGVPTVEVVEQITGRRKAEYKLPSWLGSDNVVYPSSLNLEQCSSEATARYKSNLVKPLLNAASRMADLTGGFGVDSYFLSQLAKTLDYVEPDPFLVSIARHNLTELGRSNIEYHNQTAESFITNTNEKFTLIFLDPSRRKESKKVFQLEDCLPNIIQLKNILLEKAEHVLIKTSPMLDLYRGCKQLMPVSQVTVLAVENECKELLFQLDRGRKQPIVINAVDLDPSGQIVSSISFTWEEEQNSVIGFSDPLEFLYEPNAAILKAGAFKTVGVKYDLKKLSPSTHLYTSSSLIREFPGRIFKIMKKVKPDSSLKEYFPGGMANIITRNYPMDPAAIKKKTKLKDGGDLYLICTSGQKEKYAWAAERKK